MDQCISDAIYNMSKYGYRKQNGKYECAISDSCKNVYIGTYDTEEEAINAIYTYKLNRFLEGINQSKLDINDCVLTHEKYVVFKTGEIFNLFGKQMIGMIDKCGYREVILNKKLYRVHRIVAEAFIPNPLNKPCVNHIDGNKINNKVSNLEWVTYSENTTHAYSNNLENILRGEEKSNHKLTEDDVRYIRQNKNVYSIKELSNMFNVNRRTVLSVINNESWRHVI